jgi:urease accessory protein
MLDPLLFLLQLTDSSLPIGSYSHSWGLETAVQDNRLQTAEQVKEYLLGLLHFTLAPQEAGACGLAHRYSQIPDPAALAALQQRLNAARWAEEPRRASLDLGKRLQQLAAKTWQLSCPVAAGRSAEAGLHHCLVFGWICGQGGVSRQETIKAYLFTSLTGLVSAAVRLVPLGHTEGQQILATLHTAVLQVLPLCDAEDPTAEGGISSFAPLQERDCQRHQQLYSRLFQS